MPTYDFTEKKDRRRATMVQTTRTYTRVYQLISDVRITEADALVYVTATQTLVPSGLRIGSIHPVDTGTIVTSIDIQDEAVDGLQWIIIVEWSYAITGDLNTLPLSRLPDITWGQGTESVEFFKDFAGVNILSSAGEPLTPLPQRERGYLTLLYVRNESETRFKTVVLPLMAYDVVVNSGAFTVDGQSIPALYARLEIRAGARQVEGATVFYRVEYSFTFRQGIPGRETDGWRDRYLDMGHYENAPAAPNFWTPILDSQGQMVEKPYPLDGTGHKCATPTTAPALLGPFKPYPEVSFTALGFI